MAAGDRETSSLLPQLSHQLPHILPAGDTEIERLEEVQLPFPQLGLRNVALRFAELFGQFHLGEARIDPRLPQQFSKAF